MNVDKVSSINISAKGKLKIPKDSYLINQEKINNIDAVKLAGVFNGFEQNMKSIIKTFIYTMKNYY